jgi:sec-independent protein translocase protein TatA
MPGWIGPWELGIVLVIVLVIFGPKRLPGLGKQLGSGMREFKEAITGRHKDEEEDGPSQLTAAAQATPEETASAVAAEDRERSPSS